MPIVITEDEYQNGDLEAKTREYLKRERSNAEKSGDTDYLQYLDNTDPYKEKK